MRKIVIGSLLALVTTPFILSFAASYYLQHHFISNFDTDIKINQLDFNHGWLNSTAQLELLLNQQNLIIKTDNQIKHGPIIWSNLFKNPSKSFAWYNIDTQFELISPQTGLKISDQPGTATTWINYLGQSHPHIQHPGLDFSISQAQVFADLADIKSRISANGSINASLKTNQLELKDSWQTTYLVKPELEIDLNPALVFPEKIDFSAEALSSRLITDHYRASRINLASKLNKHNDVYHFESVLDTDLLDLNQASLSDITAEFQVMNLDQQLVQFMSENYDSISESINNNEWLVLLKHFSDLLKLTSKNQPEITLALNAQSDQQMLKIDFSSQLLSTADTELNPFSLLENLNLKLEAELPKVLVTKLNQSDLIEFLDSMLEKGLLIEKHQSYYANLGFENSKLSVNH